MQERTRKNMEDRIEIRNVSKFYGRKQALKDVDLTIGRGMFGLLGRNGAGKTTLMKTLAALQGKDGGSVTVCGIPVENARKIHCITGYLPQDFSMYPSMTVWECLDYLGTLSGMERRIRRERMELLLTKVNLTAQRRKRVGALSGGMKRRLGIAQALLHDPRVLIVDEPTAGLDPEERIRFRNLLSEMARERIVILSTHIVGDIEATCGDIAVMNEGEILWQGTVERLLSEAAGRVFTVRVDNRDLAWVKERYAVTGMVAHGDSATVRLVAAEKPDCGEVSEAEPNVEDAYIYCLGSHGCRGMGGEE